MFGGDAVPPSPAPAASRPEIAGGVVATRAGGSGTGCGEGPAPGLAGLEQAAPAAAMSTVNLAKAKGDLAHLTSRIASRMVFPRYNNRARAYRRDH